MRATRLWVSTGLSAIALLSATGTAFAEEISGFITTTRTIRENSRLVGDVTCTGDRRALHYVRRVSHRSAFERLHHQWAGRSHNRVQWHDDGSGARDQ